LTLVFTARSELVALTPAAPREYGSVIPTVERGDYVAALSTFSITSLGIEADLRQNSLVFMANIFAATGLIHGPLLATRQRFP
jgi:hypothetical protein